MPVSTKYYKINNRFNKSDIEKRKPLTPEQLKEIDIPSIEEANEAIDN